MMQMGRPWYNSIAKTMVVLSCTNIMIGVHGFVLTVSARVENARMGGCSSKRMGGSSSKPSDARCLCRQALLASSTAPLRPGSAPKSTKWPPLLVVATCSSTASARRAPWSSKSFASASRGQATAKGE